MGPVSITIYFIYEVFNKIDNILTACHQHTGNWVYYYHLLYYSYRLFKLLFCNGAHSICIDKFLEKTPGIKLFYSFIRDFFEAFAGNKKKFTNSVLANVDDTDIWRVGFITQDDMSAFGMENYVAVYLPMAYSVAGNVYIVPKEKVKLITNISATQSMKFAVSGGVTETFNESMHDQCLYPLMTNIFRQ